VNSEVFRALAKGAVLLTATARQAADWKRRYAEAQPRAACETPGIYSWRSWLGELPAQEFSDISLNALQEQQLWEQIIRNDPQLPDETSEASVRGLARHASRAYALMCEYGISSVDLAPSSEESEALARWIAKIQTELRRDRLKGRNLAARMSDALLQGIEGMKLPQQILMDGFDRLSPMQQQVLEAMRAVGCNVMEVVPSGSQAAPTLTVCEDERAEHQHIAMRLKSLLDANPHARIALLCCEQSADAGRLNRILNAALMPDDTLNPASQQQAITMPGDALSNMPMILQLMHMLGIAGKPRFNFDDFSKLLFCPWLKGYEAERLDRAMLDTVLRTWNRHRLTWAGLLKTKEVQRLPQLHEVVKVLSGWAHGRKSATIWVQDVLGLLQETGFVQAGNGDRQARSNADVRQMNAFRDVLTTMAAADAVSAGMDWSHFFSMLRTVCADAQASFTPKYPNVVMMPLSSIAGLRFDYVLVMGMNEEIFPPPARPYALLPLHLQREYAIPMSTAPLAYARSRWLWDQLLLSAPCIEISYARLVGERELLPSSFTAGLAEAPCILPEPAGRAVQCEEFADTPKVPVVDSELTGGGAAMIKNQSACPFRAFVTHRLGIAALGETTPGIEPTTKGKLIHSALEFIWKRLKVRQALLEMDAAGRAEMIDDAVAYAWKKNKSHPGFDIQAVEKKRMHSVLYGWLDIEARRPDFEVLEIEAGYVLQLPQKASCQFTLKIKADRIDKDIAGHRILIDYKTGAPQTASKWLGERMEEPQLPLYAIAADIGSDDAVAYASVRSGEDMGFEGLAAKDIGIPGLTVCDGKRGRPDDWPQVLEDWNVHINALASEFADGRCDVAPRNASACKYCTLKAVCRVEETGEGA